MSTVDQTGWDNVVTFGDGEFADVASRWLADVFFPGWQYVTIAGLFVWIGWGAFNRMRKSGA